MKTKEEFAGAVRKAIKQNGGFTHNLISITLRMCAKELGYQTANELIKEFNLTSEFGIYPEEPK